MKNKIDEDRLHTYVWGYFYGFPKCCIDEFALLLDECEDRSNRKLDGTGYVPCEKCNEKSEEELVSTIKSNRLYDVPFPSETDFGDGGDDEHRDRAMFAALGVVLGNYNK